MPRSKDTTRLREEVGASFSDTLPTEHKKLSEDAQKSVSTETEEPVFTRQAFLERFEGVYEKTPWIAQEGWEKIIDSQQDHQSKDVWLYQTYPVDLPTILHAIVSASSHDAQLALLRAHPDLVGKCKLAELTEDSQSEQTGAGLRKWSQ